jgi:pimeloyl-ACP methyl ester carboxylesterase
MKKVTALLMLLACMIHNPLPAAGRWPFEVKISGSAKQSLIFIPGFACGGDVWNETTALFDKQYTCYTLTMAGFAGAAPQSGASFQNWENAIADFIRTRHIVQPVLVGHSLGGGLVLALAADYPDLISKIVVVDALPCLAALRNPSFKATEKPDCSAMISQISAMSPESFYQMQRNGIKQLVTDTARIEQLVQWSMHSDRNTFAQLFCDFSNTDLREKLSNIKCPALILLESYFANIKPAIEQQYGQLKQATLAYASKGLHFIMYDDWGWYEEKLSNFIHP